MLKQTFPEIQRLANLEDFVSFLQKKMGSMSQIMTPDHTHASIGRLAL